MQMTDEKGNVIDFEKELKQKRRKEKIEKICNKAKNIWYENKDNLVVIVPAFVAGISGLNKLANKAEQNKEQKRKERSYYDRSLGMYVDLKRKPKQSEYVKINERRQAGEKLSDILAEMNLIK